MRLTDALRLRPGMSVAFTGAGGKSSALAALAREAAPGTPVILTTSTRLGQDQAALAAERAIVRSPDDARRLDLRGTSILVTGPPQGGKLGGLSPDALEALRDRAISSGAVLSIEADGARGRWVKAPADHEPVIPSWVDLVVPVAGVRAIGERLDEAIAHRPDIFARVVGIEVGGVLGPEHLADLLTSPQGGLKGVPDRAEVRVLLSGAELGQMEGVVAGRVLGSPRVRAVLSADLTHDDPVRSVEGRTGGIVLAAGAATRLGAWKQTAVWRGVPLVGHVVRAARGGGLAPIVVVIGAAAAAVRRALEGEPVTFVENPRWAEGQSSSVDAGLAAVEARCEAAVFLLADMPRVSAATIERLRQTHRSCMASIVAPVAAGRRGNPVLFDRRTFPALHALAGDEGGRSLLARFEWTPVEVDPSEFFEVDTAADLDRLLREE